MKPTQLALFEVADSAKPSGIVADTGWKLTCGRNPGSTYRVWERTVAFHSLTDGLALVQAEKASWKGQWFNIFVSLSDKTVRLARGEDSGD